MVSPGTPPQPTEPRAAWWVRAALALLAALPPAVAAWLLIGEGWRSDPHGAFLQRVLFAVDRGRLELLGFEYPPLPFLLLLPSPTDAWTIVLGAAGIAGLAWCVVDECTSRRTLLPYLLLLAVLWTPLGLHFTAGNFNEALGLFALFVGWRHYRRWWATRKTIHGLYTGLWLGLAFYTSPLGLGLALVAGAILPILFPRLQIPPFASQMVLLVFPGAAATVTWAYLSWVFTGRVAFPFTPWERDSPAIPEILQWTVPYLVVSALALARPKATTAGMLLPFLLLAAATQTGWHFSLAFAAMLLMLVAIVALPTDLSRSGRWALATLGLAQAVAAWWFLPLPRVTDADRRDRAVAVALAGAPRQSILLDDRWAEGLLKWTPSFAPYLTTRDPGFDIALSVPRGSVRYVLVTADDDGLTLDADRRRPAGFVEDWSWAGYTLYRRPAAPRLPVRFDAMVSPSTRGALR
jgi:hypothetical protein